MALVLRSQARPVLGLALRAVGAACDEDTARVYADRQDAPFSPDGQPAVPRGA
jgi:hypothetical protein